MDCLLNADCPGGDIITVNYGYWRSGFYSTNIIKCLYKDACIGGNLSRVKDNNTEHPLCKYGYGGNLCHQCIDIDGFHFTRIGKNEYGLCPSKVENALKIAGIFIGLLITLGLLIWVNLRSQKESETSIVTRIMLNYVQIFTSAAAYNLDWPTYLTEFFGIFSSVGEVAESLISFDCFLQDASLSERGSST